MSFQKIVSSVWILLFLLIVLTVSTRIQFAYLAIYDMYFIRAIIVVSVITVIIVFAIYFLKLETTRMNIGDVQGIILGVIFSAVIVYSSIGFIEVLNSSIGTQRQKEVHGVISKKYISCKARKSCRDNFKEYNFILIDDAYRIIKVRVFKSEFDKYNLNAHYSGVWFVGCLGISYKIQE